MIAMIPTTIIVILKSVFANPEPIMLLTITIGIFPTNDTRMIVLIFIFDSAAMNVIASSGKKGRR